MSDYLKMSLAIAAILVAWLMVVRLSGILDDPPPGPPAAPDLGALAVDAGTETVEVREADEPGWTHAPIDQRPPIDFGTPRGNPVIGTFSPDGSDISIMTCDGSLRRFVRVPGPFGTYCYREVLPDGGPVRVLPGQDGDIQLVGKNGALVQDGGAR